MSIVDMYSHTVSEKGMIKKGFGIFYIILNVSKWNIFHPFSISEQNACLCGVLKHLWPIYLPKMKKMYGGGREN